MELRGVLLDLDGTLIDHEAAAAEELGVAKPAAGAYLAACQQWGLPPSSVLHIGDRYDLDVEAARSAGLRCDPPGSQR